MKLSNTLMLLGSLITFSSCDDLARKTKPSTSETVLSVNDNAMASTVIADAQKRKKTSPNINSKESATSAETNTATTPSDKVGNPEKNQTTPLSYEQWKEENEKRLNEKYDDKRREDKDRDNNDLLRSIETALVRPDLSAAKKAELDFVSNLLKKAALVNDASVKKAAYDEALGVLTSVLSP